MLQADQLCACRATWTTVCRVQRLLLSDQQGSLMISQPGQGTRTCVQLAAEACQARYLSLTSAQEARQLWPLLSQATPPALCRLAAAPARCARSASSQRTSGEVSKRGLDQPDFGAAAGPAEGCPQVLSCASAQACVQESVLVCHLHRDVPALQSLLKGLDAALATGSLTLLAQATCPPESSSQGERC